MKCECRTPEYPHPCDLPGARVCPKCEMQLCHFCLAEHHRCPEPLYVSDILRERELVPA